MKTYFKAGSWNAVCMVCGFRFKAQELMKRWDGLMVCEKDYELDHPQKYLRVQSDPKPVPFVSPEQEDDVLVCTIVTSSGYADLGTADCAKADNNTYSYSFLVSINTQVPEGTF